MKSIKSGASSSSRLVADMSDGTSCTFTSRNYAIGDVWYPRLGQRGALHCVACICQEVKTIQNGSFDSCCNDHPLILFSFSLGIRRTRHLTQGGKINCTIHECGGQDCASPESATTNECCIHCSSKLRNFSSIETRLKTIGVNQLEVGKRRVDKTKTNTKARRVGFLKCCVVVKRGEEKKKVSGFKFKKKTTRRDLFWCVQTSWSCRRGKRRDQKQNSINRRFAIQDNTKHNIWLPLPFLNQLLSNFSNFVLKRRAANRRLWQQLRHVRLLSTRRRFQCLRSRLRIWAAVRRHLASPVCTTATSTVTRSDSPRPMSDSNRNTPTSASSVPARSVNLIFVLFWF